ncbi:cytochrome c class I [Marinobacter lipolyticus SM19]|uniref:Cytochrome c class I n=1 Tax=Marinobacter lipolyticus SM19 TaxID=1318628 RepID=R8AZK1_9GAMM|nr:cytochrome c class I [Marinobacter lipolyticus]EON91766.1 cytochrome c class I [Marinobacter lipolyticus SM19]
MRSTTKRLVIVGLILAGWQAMAQGKEVSLSEKLTASHCGACHTFKRDEPHGMGPNLHGLLDRPAGSAPGYDYSDSFLQRLGGQPWSRELLDAWLADTQALAPGSAMTYFQDDPGKRELIIQYFESSN